MGDAGYGGDDVAFTNFRKCKSDPIRIHAHHSCRLDDCGYRKGLEIKISLIFEQTKFEKPPFRNNYLTLAI
jgi:hypothetical protein